MPFTPYHFGASGSLGLVFRRWVDLPMFVLANVVIDLEVLFAAGAHPHRHWHWHSLLVGGLVGAAFGAAVYLAAPVRGLLVRLMHLVRIGYRPRLVGMVLGGMLGAWMHVLIDGLYHYDVEPFWPAGGNPLYRFARVDLGLGQAEIRTICLAFWGVAIVLYAAAVWSFYRKRRRGEDALK